MSKLSGLEQKNTEQTYRELISKHSIDMGFMEFGFSKLEQAPTFAHYQSWIENKFHGNMNYLEEHLKFKKNPKLKFPKFNSVITFIFPYHNTIPKREEFPLKTLKIARYAQGADYHHFLNEKLNNLIQILKPHFPDEEFLCYADSAPLMERDFASHSGLGWFGKNTCLIHPKHGSFFLIAEILTTSSIRSEKTGMHDFCGKCTKCLDLCPTQAIRPDKVLDATRCISYWTIEAKSNPPVELRNKFQDLFFGCDICQEVCPWNQKILTSLVSNTIPPGQRNNDNLISELKMILDSSGKQLTKVLKSTPLLRAGPNGLKRNALIVIGNLKIKELLPLVKKYLEHEKLSDLAQWTIKNLTSS